MRKKYGILDRGNKRVPWTEELITSIGEGLALVVENIEQEDFVNRCVDAVPNRKPAGNVRDTRRQDIVRALRRMAANDRLPFRVSGEHFVF